MKTRPYTLFVCQRNFTDCGPNLCCELGAFWVLLLFWFTILPTQAQTPDTTQISSKTVQLKAVDIDEKKEESFGKTTLNSIENFGIYEAKKTEVVVLKDLTANLATNNPRQVYARIVGLNIWESDGAGLQLGIGGRGLSPNRTANFNTRQNGYDISADALGYPESYYTPPTEALDRIEVVRGAASLQYGTQFGGMLNFRFNKGVAHKKWEVVSRLTGGSWGFLNSFTSVGGTAKKWNYYGFYQRKQGNGWRPNAAFEVNTGYAQTSYQATAKLLIHIELTRMDYLAQQPGGLTDQMFQQNARQSVRPRNWFKVDWNMASVSADYRFTDKTRLNVRNFGLWSRRQSLGNLDRINVADQVVQNRTLIDGTFHNIGNEIRLLHNYAGRHALLVGSRLYHGTTTAKQGDANGGSGPDFKFLNADNVEGSDFRFPNANYALFAENIFRITPTFSLTPGVRWEFIRTVSEGFYKQRVFDFAGNLIVDNRITDNRTRSRNFFIFGLGASLKPKENHELYANISQNYRAINFTDLRVVNPNFAVDPNIRDERGYTADIGARGSLKGFFSYDVSAFLIAYNGRIGQILQADKPPLFLDYRLRKNIADARNLGLEMFGELNLLKLLKQDPAKRALAVFVNLALVDARYINTQDNSVKGKKVELVPPVTFRTGINGRWGAWGASMQYNYVAKQFSDATNAIRTSTAIEGEIPAYQVVDFSLKYGWRWLSVEGTLNNVLDERYFTRRADSYPGPGIIPSDGRGVYVTVGVRL